MVALRYDIRIRNNAFAFRVERDGEEFVSDISEYKPETADDAHSEARNFNELGLRDNPYAVGGPRYGWDPHTGQRCTKANTAKTSSAKGATQTASSQPAPSPFPQSSTPFPQAPSSLPTRPYNSDQAQNRTQRSSGYKGKNFNPNHGNGYKRKD
jgi:hypothetical protein